LRVKVLFLFAALISTAGLLLAWWDYRQQETASLTSADALVARGAAGIEGDLQGYTAATVLQLHLLRTADIVIDRALWAAPAQAPALIAMLRTTDGIPDVYTGYPDGRFMLVRPLATADERERYNAPYAARYLMQLIDAPSRPGTYVYLDAAGREITRAKRAAYMYDPRSRPWFAAARVDGAIVTAVYRFATSRQMGYTIALRAANGAVVAADVDLHRLSARLRAVLPTPGSAAAIVDPSGVAVAASDDVALARAGALAPDGLAKIGAVSPLLAAAYFGAQSVITDAAGERTRAYVAMIGTSASGPRRLVVVIPERDLIATAQHVRDETLVATAALLLLWIPLIWWVAGRISRPLQQLQREAAKLLTLDFADPPPNHSFIHEVALLVEAFAAVRRRLRRYLALSGQLASERSLPRILDTMIAEVVDACQAAGGALVLDQNGTVTDRAACGTAIPDSVWESRGLAQRALAGQQTVQGPIDSSGTAALAVPLRSRRGGVWGTAVVVRDPGECRPFSESSRAYAEALAGSAAIAIEAQGTLASLERYGAAAQRFVPTEFASQLGRADIRALRLGDHVSRRMIVMFVHLHGVKAAAAKAGADEGFAILERFFALTGPIVREHGGFIDKYIGDMAMALFPYRPDEAVGAALTIVRELEAECRRWSERFGVHFESATGLHGGGLMLGTIGEERRFETTVIADVVNVASRISGLTAMFGVPLLASGEIGVELRLSRRRRLAECAVKGARRPIFIEEIYAADEEDLARAKDASAERFDTGRRFFAAGEFAAAEAIFAGIVAAEPRDRPAAFFRDRCAAGAAPDWNGIVRFTSK
jgi:class 3 adenylate cyclase